MSTNTAMLIYRQMILPYFEYCDFLIDAEACCKREQDKLEKIQYQGLRIIYKNEIQENGKSGFITVIRYERVEDYKEMSPAEPNAWEKRGKWHKQQNRTTRN